MKGFLRMFARERDRRPLKPEPKMEVKQTKLEDFNMNSSNNNSSANVMEELDVDHIIFERGEGYDKKE